MKESFEEMLKVVNTSEVQEIAKVLAKYGLGICVPHMHETSTGSLIPLPKGVVSCERNLQVSFEESTTLSEKEMIPAAWRWNGTEIEVCATCCGWQE